MSAVLFVALCVVVGGAIAQEAGNFERVELTGLNPDAVCNDGSPATYVHDTQHATHNTPPHATRNTQHETRNTIHNTQYTIHNTQYTIHNTQYTIHNTQYTMHNATPPLL
jgi:hypothetical protein